MGQVGPASLRRRALICGRVTPGGASLTRPTAQSRMWGCRPGKPAPPGADLWQGHAGWRFAYPAYGPEPDVGLVGPASLRRRALICWQGHAGWRCTYPAYGPEPDVGL